MADRFPPPWSKECPYNKGRVWPAFGEDYSGTAWDMFARLSSLCERRPDLANEFAMDSEFAAINANLAEFDLPQWPRAELVAIFNDAVEGYLTEIAGDNDARREHKRGREKARNLQRIRQAGAGTEPGKPGKKPGEQSARVAVISETLGVNRRRGYDIDAHGTALFEDRQKLAAAFAHDPERNTPAKWDTAFGNRVGRKVQGGTFAEYVLSGVDAFEGPVSDTLGRLLPLYQRGYAREYFTDYRAFVSEMLALGATDSGAQVATWDAYQAWRERTP